MVSEVSPGLVGKVRVGGYGVDFNAEILELRIVVGEIAELGRADEGEVGRVEEDDGPFALRLSAHRHELAGGRQWP